MKLVFDTDLVFGKLNLSGVSAFVFSMIYGCSQYGEDSGLIESVACIADTLNVSRQCIYDTLKSLKERNLINESKVVKDGRNLTVYSVTEFVKKVDKPDEDFDIDISEFISNNNSTIINSNSTINNSSINTDIDTIPPISETYISSKEKVLEKKSFFDLSFVRPDFLPSVEKWLKYKSDRRESYKTQSSLKVMYNNLFKYAHGNAELAMRVVEQSIGNNYAGLFELKGYDGRRNNGDNEAVRTAVAKEFKGRTTI